MKLKLKIINNNIWVFAVLQVLLGILRMQRTDCALVGSFLRILFVMSNLEQQDKVLSKVKSKLAYYPTKVDPPSSVVFNMTQTQCM